MTFHFYPLQDVSSRLTRSAEDEEGTLGVAVFRLAQVPDDDGTYAIHVYERDRQLSESLRRSAGGGRRARRRSASRVEQERATGSAPQSEPEREDDRLGTLTCTISAGRPAFSEEVTDAAAGEDGDPTVTVVVRLEDDTEARWTLRVPGSASDDDRDPWLEFGLLPEGDEGWGGGAPVRLRGPGRVQPIWWPPAPFEGEEWDLLGEEPPRASDGETTRVLGGYRIVNKMMGGRESPHVELAPGAYAKLQRGAAGWGLKYFGRNAFMSMQSAVSAIAEGYREQGDHYRALATKASSILNEGKVSAVNTYDDMYVSLGMGWAADKLKDLLDGHEGRAHELLSEILNRLGAYEDGWLTDKFPTGRDVPVATKWTDVAKQVRLDVSTFARFVQLSEHRYFCFDAAKANVQNFVGGLIGGSSEAEIQAAGELAAQGEPVERRALLGVVGYLRHGRPAWVYDPVAEWLAVMDGDRLLRAAEILGLTLQEIATPRARMALLLKRHAEFGMHWGGFDSPLIAKKLAKKIHRFELAMRLDADDAGWLFHPGEGEGDPSPDDEQQLQVIKAILPCYVGPDASKADEARWSGAARWRGTTERPANGRVRLRRRGRYYDFGPPVIASDDSNFQHFKRIHSSAHWAGI